MGDMTEILTAISKAMGAVKILGRDGKNTHDGYKFASIDGFLAMVNPICAEHGLIVHMDELPSAEFTKKGRNGETAWLRTPYVFTTYHTSGQSLPPVTRNVDVMRNGSQASGSAQSYALKMYLRALLQIPTGDGEDADLNRTEEGTTRRDYGGAPASETGKVLTRTEGATILAAVAQLADWRAVDDYEQKLAEGPMAHALKHPKIEKALADRRAAISAADPIILGDQRAGETPADDFPGDRVRA